MFNLSDKQIDSYVENQRNDEKCGGCKPIHYDYQKHLAKAKVYYKELQEIVSKYQDYNECINSFKQQDIRDYQDCADLDYKNLTVTISNRNNKPVLTTDVEIWDDMEAIFVGSYDIDKI